MADGAPNRVELQVLPAPEPVEHGLIQAHVVVVVVAVAAGAIAATSAWGSPRHRLAGKVAATSAILSVVLVLAGARMPIITFWTAIAVPYTVWRGRWWIGKASARAPWLAYGLGVVLSAPALAAWAAYAGDAGQAFGTMVFALPVGWLVSTDLRATPADRPRAHQLREHLTGMLGAMTLLWENFLPRRIGFLKVLLPDVLVALLPAIVGLLLIVALRRRVTDSTGLA